MKRKILAVLVCVALAVCTVMPVISYLEIMQTGLGNGSANRWNEDAKELSDSICKDLKSDEDKAKALYNWIIEHIEYDYDYQEIYQHFNVSKTLSTRKGLCFDYANLFVVFCRSQDIPCFVVDGYSRSDSLAKHTWNRVYFSNTWWNADLTNDAINTKNGKTLYGFHPLDNYDSEDEDFVITRIY